MALAIIMMLGGAVLDPPRFYGWSGLALGLYCGAYTVEGARTGVYWSRYGPIYRSHGLRYVRYMAASAVLTLAGLALCIYSFVTA